MLQCLQYVNNFSLRKQLGDKWTLAMSQEGMLNKSLMTLVAVNDTRQGASPHVCKLQVSGLVTSHATVTCYTSAAAESET